MGAINYGSLTGQPGGGYQATVSGTPDGTLTTGGGEDMGWLLALAKRRAEQKLQAGETANQLARLQLKHESALDNPQLASGPGYYEKNMQALALKDAFAKSRAMTGVAPTKTTYIGNSAGFQSPDESAMTGYQRQAFLPGGSGFSGPSLAEFDQQGRQDFSAYRDNATPWGSRSTQMADALLRRPTSSLG